jgi:hypothetical protein
MDPFIPEPRDRLEMPICKAIESKDYKQALKLVEKRLSKSADPYLQVGVILLSLINGLSPPLCTKKVPHLLRRRVSIQLAYSWVLSTMLWAGFDWHTDQALKFFIQCSHPLVIERGKGLAAFWDLLEKKEKQHTSDELNLYDEAINVAFPGNRGLESIAICKMRADAVKNSPKDEQLSLSCLRGCLARDNLEFSQQVSTLVLF